MCGVVENENEEIRQKINKNTGLVFHGGAQNMSLNGSL